MRGRTTSPERSSSTSGRLALLCVVAITSAAGCATSESGDAPENSNATAPASETWSVDDPADTPGNCQSPAARKVTHLANLAREERGKQRLRCSRDVSRVALAHAKNMCKKQYMGHVDREGRSPGDRLDAHGVDWRAYGENVAYGQNSAYQVHKGWMESPGHRKNILRPPFDTVGVAVIDCGRVDFWAQVFIQSPSDTR